jgi:hypothetical protein
MADGRGAGGQGAGGQTPTPWWRALGRRFTALEHELETSLRPWLWLTGIVFVGWLTLVIASMPDWGGDPFNDRAFDAAAWRAADGGARDCPRGEMITSLAAGELRAGRPRAELIALLGPPDEHDAPRWCSWRIGWWSGLRVDQDALELHFDPDGQLSHWARAQR